MINYEPEQVYQDFWKEIICDEDGNIDIEQVKKELCDFYKMIQEVPKVYSAITDGHLSKPIWDAETVLSYFYETFANKAWLVDLLIDDWDLIIADCKTNEDYKRAIFEYFGIDDNHTVFNDIKQGLQEAIDYERGKETNK